MEVCSYVFKQLLVFFLKAIDLFPGVLSHLRVLQCLFSRMRHPFFVEDAFHGIQGIAVHRFFPNDKTSHPPAPMEKECCPLLRCQSELTMVHLPSSETHWTTRPFAQNCQTASLEVKSFI